MIGQTFPKVEIRPRKADGTSMTAEQAATVKAGDAVRYGRELIARAEARP